MIDVLAEELVELTDVELDEFIRDQELARREAESKLALAVAAADARQLYVADGHRSMKGYLKATCNWSNGEVARVRSAARLIDEHEQIGDAWLQGRAGSSQVSELAKVKLHDAARERFCEFVPTLTLHAEQLPFDDFTVVLDRLVTLADADGRLDERAAIERRSATVADVSGELFLSMSGGDSLVGAEFAEIVRRFEQDELDKDGAAQHADREAGRDPRPLRTGPQRRFDALIAIARAAVSHTGKVAVSEPLVSVLVDQRTMSWVFAHSGLGATATLDAASIDPFTGLPLAEGALDDLLGDPETFLDRRCETSTGAPLRPSDVLRAVLSGHVRRVVLGAKSRVVDMGRASRVYTGASRDAATLLTTTCEHPGCDMPADWCQVDHMTEWHALGATEQRNAAVECAAHNIDKHRRKRRTRRAMDGRLHTFRPDGTIVLPVGCRTPRFDDDDDSDDHADDDRFDAEPELATEAERMLIEAARARIALLTAADRAS